MKGRFNPREQSYDAAIRADSFPLNSFLPADSLGIVDLTLQARGTGFDPLLPRDPDEPPGADRPRGVRRTRLRGHRTRRRTRQPASFRTDLRPRRGAPAAAVRLRNADRTRTAHRPLGQRLRVRPGRAGRQPGADRRIVRPRCLRIRRRKGGLRRPHRAGQHRNPEQTPDGPHPPDERLAAHRLGRNPGRSGFRRPVADVLHAPIR